MMIPAFQQRLLDEQRDLSERQVKLSQFIVSEQFRHCSPRQQFLLQAQEQAMLTYLHILDMRVHDLASNPPYTGET